MKLPIDIVPNTDPPQFHWKQTVSSPVGTSVSMCAGHLPPSVEKPVADLIGIAHDLGNRVTALQKFKDWVHAYLDARGVPTNFPDGEHTKCGCRIGDRMDWWSEQMTALSAENEKLLRQVEELSAKLEQGKATLTTVANAPPDGKGISSKKARG